MNIYCRLRYEALDVTRYFKRFDKNTIKNLEKFETKIFVQITDKQDSFDNSIFLYDCYAVNVILEKLKYYDEKISPHILLDIFCVYISNKHITNYFNLNYYKNLLKYFRIYREIYKKNYRLHMNSNINKFIYEKAKNELKKYKDIFKKTNTYFFVFPDMVIFKQDIFLYFQI